MEKTTQYKRIEYEVIESFDNKEFDTEQECLEHEHRVCEEQYGNGIDILQKEFSN